MINVYEFIWMCCDDSMLKVRLYDVDNDEEVYAGYLNDMPVNLQTAYVASYDMPSTVGELTLNITMTED